MLKNYFLYSTNLTNISIVKKFLKDTNLTADAYHPKDQFLAEMLEAKVS